MQSGLCFNLTSYDVELVQVAFCGNDSGTVEGGEVAADGCAGGHRTGGIQHTQNNRRDDSSYDGNRVNPQPPCGFGDS
jgi:hypothetical protein